MTNLECDVLVLGAGAAGLMAAIEANSAGADVLIVNKGPAGHSGSTMMAIGAMAAVDSSWMEAGDSIGLHLDDTLKSGCYINNVRLAKAVVGNAACAAKKIESMGVAFDRDAVTGEILLLRRDGGHSKNRALSSQRRIGREILQTLYYQTAARGIRIIGNMYAVKILKDDNGYACGCVCVDKETLETVAVNAKATIAATGGICGLYANTDVPEDITGSGICIAYEAGAELTDMEFVQFHPLGLVKPDSFRGVLGAHLTFVRLLNSRGERFMESYDPVNMELTTRDVVSRAIATEIREGRGIEGNSVLGSLQHMSESELSQKGPEYLKIYKYINFDYKTGYLRLAPTAHYTMGGIRVDDKWKTSVPGLFAAGEACGGVHGANRLSQNALTEALVSGMISGRSAYEYAVSKKRKSSAAEDVSAEFSRRYAHSDGLSPFEWRARLKSVMSEKAGVLRDEKSLLKAENEIQSLMEMKMSAGSGFAAASRLVLAAENEKMAKLALTVVKSAMERKESRGSHQRTDYPEQSGDYLCNFITVNRDGVPAVERRECVK